MKYLVFIYCRWYPYGGIKDLAGICSTNEEVYDLIEKVWQAEQTSSLGATELYSGFVDLIPFDLIYTYTKFMGNLDEQDESLGIKRFTIGYSDVNDSKDIEFEPTLIMNFVKAPVLI